MKPLAYLHLSCLLLLSAACLAQDGIKTQYAPIQQDSCPQGSDRMYLFFEGEPIDYTYKKLGIVEAEAGNSVSTWQMLNCLKYEAWNNCANAVIAITEKSKGDPDANSYGIGAGLEYKF